MRNLFFLFVLAVVIIFSCKKKDDTKNITTTVVGTTGTTGSPSGTVAVFTGLCSNQKTYYIINGFTYSGTYAQNLAMFSANVFNNFNLPLGTLQNAGTLKLNDTIFNNNSGYYTDPTNTVKTNPFIWSCDGGAVPAFSYTNTNNYATYADYVHWPDTIKKSEGFSILFAALQQAQEAEIILANHGGGSAITFSALTSAGSHSLTPANLASLLTSTTALIQCNFFRNNVQDINGKLINFRTTTSFVKNNVQVSD